MVRYLGCSAIRYQIVDVTASDGYWISLVQYVRSQQALGNAAKSPVNHGTGGTESDLLDLGCVLGVP